MMGGGPSGSSGGGTGSTANVYTPQQQGAADVNFWRALQPMINTGVSGIEQISSQYGSPSANAYQQAYDPVVNYLRNNPYAGQSMNAAQTGYNSWQDMLFPQSQAGSAALFGAAQGGLPYAPQAIAGGFDPAYTGLVGTAEQDPNLWNYAIPGAERGAQIGQRGATGLEGLAGGVLSGAQNPLYESITQGALHDPYQAQAAAGAQQAAGLGNAGAQGMMRMGQTLEGAANPLFDASRSILNTGFDPQSALFNRSQQQLLDQSNAINAMSGIASTPYGASTTANALGNFDINWQNQQLARQAQAAQAASGAVGQGGAALGEAGSLWGAAPGLAAGSAALPSAGLANYYNRVGNAANQQNLAMQSGLGSAGPGYAGASGLATQSAMGPTNAMQNYQQNLIRNLQARNVGAGAGASTYDALLGGATGGMTGAMGLGSQGASGLAGAGAAPYNAATTVGQNALSGLTGLAQLGNSAFALPHQTMQDELAYMGKGQSASELSGQLGQLGFNQMAQGLGGGLSGLNSLLGQNSLLGGSSGIFGGGGLGGLFGGGAGAMGDFGGGGAALGVADELGTGQLFSAAPLAMSA